MPALARQSHRDHSCQPRPLRDNRVSGLVPSVANICNIIQKDVYKLLYIRHSFLLTRLTTVAINLHARHIDRYIYFLAILLDNY